MFSLAPAAGPGPDPRYADLIERTLYNVVATSPSARGQRVLLREHAAPAGARDGPADRTRDVPRASSSLRAPWFEVSCCPPNVARTLASLGGVRRDGRRRRPPAAPVRAVAASARRWPTAAAVELDVETDYPRDGRGPGARRDDRGPAVDAHPAGARRGPRARSCAHAGRRAAGRRPARSSVHRRFARGRRRRAAPADGPAVSRGPTRASTPSAAAWWSSAARRCSALESVDLDGADVSGVRLDLGAGVREVDGRVLVTVVTGAPADDAWPYGPRAGTRRTGHARRRR